LYQIHNQDPQTPLEETLSALDFLIKQGKVRYIGLSNHPAWKIVKASYISQKQGYANFISGQFLYNLLKRDIEIEILPACKDLGIGVLCWSPLSGGMLTGKYINKDKPEEGTRLESRKDVVKDRYIEWYKKSEAIVSILKEIASKNNISPSLVSLAWLLKNRIVTSTIIGATSLSQITENIKASDWFINEEDWESLNNISKVNYGYPNDVYDNTTKGWFENIV
jgi:aryl-alcohol dehydrogenase-like predicted oxidoreductase